MLVTICSALAIAATVRGEDPYTSSEIETIRGYFWTNVDVAGSGAVIAAPSNNHPDYAYHWMRDGAISMNIANEVLQNRTAMESYAQWVTGKTQVASDPNGIDVRGEPKFYMDGRVYDKPWGRPQNDGPALRAIALINYANYLISQGQKDKVLSELYFSDLTSNKGIKYDLEYISHNWSQSSFDLWEEVNGDHFFTKMVQRKALVLGAALANALGDSGAGTFYKQQASAMEDPIRKHWNAGTGVIMATTPPHPGPQKYNEIDSAVHLGVLYGYAGDDFFGYDSDQVTSSVAKYQDVMCGAGQPYPINTADDQAGIPGCLTGRYPNDTYDGYGQGTGNPWVLTTQSLANYYYRTAHAILERHEALNATHMVVTELNHGLISRALEAKGWNGPLIVPGSKVHVGAVALALAQDADGLLLRVKNHIKGAGLHMPEELNLNTGDLQGAPDLTWSYGTLIDALAARDALAQTLA